MIKQAKAIQTVTVHHIRGQFTLLKGTIYTVRREGEDFLFLEEIEGGIVGINKNYFEILPTIEEAEKASGLTVAVKHDSDKPRLDLLSVCALNSIAQVMTYGAIKYSAHNWRKGFDWSRLYAAALRHLLAHMNGEDKDPETGLSHLAHASCCLMFLLEHEIRGLGKDDRYKGRETI